MKLIFVKNGNDYSTKIMQDSEECEFNYVDFIKLVCSGQLIEPPEFLGEISEEERRIITEFVEDIRKRVDENKEGLPTTKKRKASFPRVPRRDRFMEK